jgi:small-conductance mechanosensitive channel
MTAPAFLLVLHLIPESEKLAEMGIRLVLTVVGGFLLMELGYLLVGRLQMWMAHAGRGRAGSEQRARTLAQIFRNLVTTVVWAGAAIHALAIFGWDVRPLLAGAGILGVALGFGAQTLVRDLIAGYFILIENQFGVGDLVDVNGQPSIVEEVTLRTTRLRGFNGFVHYVPNGEFKTVTNRSRDWSRLTVDVPVGANEDLGRALRVCREVVDGLNAEPAWRARLLEPAELWGVESLIGPEVMLRMVVKANPGGDAYQVSRELRLRCHEALVAGGIRAGTGREIAITPTPAGGPALRVDAPTRRVDTPPVATSPQETP